MRKVFLYFFIFVMLCFGGGCNLFDSESSKDDSNLKKIDQLTMGGGIFLINSAGIVTVQLGVFYGTEPFENADIFVNGIELFNQGGGIYRNSDSIDISSFSVNTLVKIVVYALGDSVVKEINIPEEPEILSPQENFTVSAGDSLDLNITFPGTHDYIAVNINNPEPVNDISIGYKTSENLLKTKIPSSMLPSSGSSTITAYSACCSGEIPDEFDVDDQYSIFIVGSVSVRDVKF